MHDDIAGDEAHYNELLGGGGGRCVTITHDLHGSVVPILRQSAIFTVIPIFTH